MCVDPVSASVIIGVVSTLSSAVSSMMQINASNDAAASQYNQQARQAERVNQEAIRQQRETDARNRLETLRNADSAAEKSRLQIMENRKAMGAARASAGTSGLMGLPLNMITQNYESLIGGLGTNLQTTYKQLNENLFFNNMDTMLRAQSISNQAIPNKPHLQSYGFGHAASAALSGIAAGVGSYRPAPKVPVDDLSLELEPMDNVIM